MTDSPHVVADPQGNVTHQRFGRIQRIIATRMSESHATIPDFSMSVDVDVEDLLQRREAIPRDGRPSLNDFVIEATADALRLHPRLNSSFRADGIDVHSRVNVGVAVAAGDALVVVTIFDADELSVEQIGGRTIELGESVRNGSVSMGELEGATFTISNLGMFGVDRMVPIIIPGQVGILGVGSARPRVVPTPAGDVVVRRLLTLTLSGDHRVMNGTDAAKFLTATKSALEDPGRLIGIRVT